MTHQPFIPPVHYERSDGAPCCVHATPVGPDSCRFCRELADDDAILRAAVEPCRGCEAEERTRGVIQLSALELYPPAHDDRCPTRRPR